MARTIGTWKEAEAVDIAVGAALLKFPGSDLVDTLSAIGEVRHSKPKSVSALVYAWACEDVSEAEGLRRDRLVKRAMRKHAERR